MKTPRSLIIRNTCPDDVDNAVAVEKQAWCPPWPQDCVFDNRHIESQLRFFPEGQFCAELNGEFAGFVTTMCTEYDVSNPRQVTWAEMCADGFITNHLSYGKTIFGVNASVSPKFARMGVSDMLLDRVGVMCIERGLQQIILGSRIPSYSKHSDEMSAVEYVYAKGKGGKPIDPELRLYTSHSLKIVTVVPDYIPEIGRAHV